MRNLSLQVKDFRAIKDANISLNGISVLSGINSTGKSTLSKLLYYIVKLTLDFEKIATSRLFEESERTIQALNKLLNDFDIDLNILPDWRKFNRNNKIDVFNSTDSVITYLDITKNAFLKNKNHYTKTELLRISSAIRFGRITSRTKGYQPIISIDVDSIESVFNEAKAELENLRKEVIKEIKERPLTTFAYNLSGYFNNLNLDLTVDFSENDTSIIDKNRNRVNNLYTVGQIFYVNTPMALQVSGIDGRIRLDGNSVHWEHLRDAVRASEKLSLNESGQKVFSSISEIISGVASVEKSELHEKFMYSRKEDGLRIELAESATGINSFSILQLLLSHGLLNDETLLILDEPEAHLHPQWIVEYARVIVLLNKHLGVRFMLASHSPDMVSALRYIAEKEEVLNNINFYLAKEVENKQYIFENLKDDINPIFESFNIAFDKIRAYGV